MKKTLMNILALTMSLGLANQNDCGGVKKEEKQFTDNVGGGYEHEGMYSQAKKLRKGAGKKKLTRAQRKAKKYVRNH